MKTQKGCSSDEIVEIIQKAIDDLYSDETETVEQANEILWNLQSPLRSFLINMTSQMTDDESLAMLAEIDHRLNYNAGGFKIDYDISPTGKSGAPYDIGIEYGDLDLGTVRIIVNSLSN